MKCDEITAVVLAYNEALNIRACLESIAGFCPIHVIDSGSDDGTPEIARRFTDHVHFHPYENHARQWEWALDKLPIRTEWILALDADFTVTDALKARIGGTIGTLPERVAGVYVRHRYKFGGGEIRFGGTKQHWLRIVRRGRASPDLSDLVDFRFVVDGETRRWPEAVVEYNRNDDDISVWLNKQDKFSLRLAVEEELRRSGGHRWQVEPRFFGNTDERFAWLRDRWLGLPLFLRPAIYFFYRYIVAGGFLDGRAGFLYHALQGFWLRTIVDWKIAQLRQAGLTGNDLERAEKAMLQTRSGSVTRLLDGLQSPADSFGDSG